MRNNEFKAAVGKYPTGVTIVSTNYQNALYGFTANSFTSVSLNPPLVLFCLDKKARSFLAFYNSDSFGISILAYNQSDISRHFSSSKKDKFIGIDYVLGDICNVPLINGAVCWLECTTYSKIECGDHFIFAGEVNTARINNSKGPLIYFAKSYKELQ